MDHHLWLQIRTAASSGDHVKLADLLWVPVPGNPPPQSEALRNLILAASTTEGLPPEQSLLSAPPLSSAPLSECLASHRRLLRALPHEPVEAFQQSLAALQALLRLLPGESRAELPLLRRLCTNLYYLAVHADRAVPSSSSSPTSGKAGEEAARLLSKAFTISITDRAPLGVSKKWLSLALANILFRLYFRLGTVRLCANIVRALDTTIKAEFPSFNQLPKADVITFRYYRARLAINQNDFKGAESFLLPALALCPAHFPRQQRELVIYLTLVKLIHGQLPRPELLRRHGLEEAFLPLAQAVRSGDLRLFDRVLLANQAFYMRKELFLLIQLHLRNLILRSLFKKVYLIGLASAAHQENRLNLRLLEAILAALGIPEMGMDEVECIMANLIFHVRGKDCTGGTSHLLLPRALSRATFPTKRAWPCSAKKMPFRPPAPFSSEARQRVTALRNVYRFCDPCKAPRYRQYDQTFPYESLVATVYCPAVICGDQGLAGVSTAESRPGCRCGWKSAIIAPHPATRATG